MIRAIAFAAPLLLATNAAEATDCETLADGGLGSMECWHEWPFTISTAELSRNGYELISASMIAATSEADRQLGQTAHYEISYWRGSRFLFQCRSLFRDDGELLRMTASRCRSTQAPPENENLWSTLRRNAPS